MKSATSINSRYIPLTAYNLRGGLVISNSCIGECEFQGTTVAVSGRRHAVVSIVLGKFTRYVISCSVSSY